MSAADAEYALVERVPLAREGVALAHAEIPRLAEVVNIDELLHAGQAADRPHLATELYEVTVTRYTELLDTHISHRATQVNIWDGFRARLANLIYDELMNTLENLWDQQHRQPTCYSVAKNIFLDLFDVPPGDTNPPDNTTASAINEELLELCRRSDPFVAAQIEELDTALRLVTFNACYKLMQWSSCAPLLELSQLLSSLSQSHPECREICLKHAKYAQDACMIAESTISLDLTSKPNYQYIGWGTLPQLKDEVHDSAKVLCAI